MKRITILAIIALQLGFSGNVLAQVTVNNHGKFTVGNNMHTSYDSEDRDNILSATIFGKEGSFNALSKLSFGDFGSREYYSWNVFIGEYDQTFPDYPQYESDQLWLHGKNGVYFTYNTANNDASGIIAYFDVSKSLNFTFAQNVQSPRFLTQAPVYKNSIVPLEKSLNRLTALTGIHYINKAALNSNQLSQPNNQNLSPKEAADMAFFSQLQTEMQNNEDLRIGLRTEELAEVFPELIDTTNEGEIYIDYIGLIPVIIEALKEQSQIIRAQSMKINELNDSTTTSILGSTTSQSKNTMTSNSNNDTPQIYNAFLYQNTPNPFNTETEIKYFLPEETTSASILIFNMQGNLIMSYTLSPDFGFGSIFVSASSLNAGAYFYTLIVNNHEIETKKMILTQ